jgi:hypothetical protein
MRAADAVRRFSPWVTGAVALSCSHLREAPPHSSMAAAVWPVDAGGVLAERAPLPTWVAIPLPAGCSPVAESCNGVDDDCNGLPDDGTPCDDGIGCTVDNCSTDGCTHDAAACGCQSDLDCPAPDLCSPPGQCDLTASPHVCLPGAGPGVVCPNAGACLAATCVPASGQCVTKPKPNDTSCDDGSLCTSADHCSEGDCVGAALGCDDGQPCTADSCEPGLGCLHAPQPGTCSDDDPCTANDQCLAGSCVAGVAICECKTNTDCAGKAAGNACIGQFSCVEHACALVPGTGVVCPAAGACQTAACDPGSGKCLNKPGNEGWACDDDNACTVADHCTGGDCAGVPANCDDGEPCTADSCLGASGCVHAPLLTPCNDGDACTQGDSCASGSCAGVAIDCTDDNPCTIDFCVNAQCKHDSAAAVGQPCTPVPGCPGPGVCKSAYCKPAGPCNGKELWPPVFPPQFGPAQQLWDPVGYHTIALQLPVKAWSQYLAEVAAASPSGTWFAADAVVDGKSYPGVGIRKFGYGSNLVNPKKPNIRIGFDHYASKTFGPDGVKNLRLKSSGQDNTFLRQPLAQVMVQQAGGYAPRFSFARVTVNGSDYGLYQVFEQADKRMFQQWFGNDDGERYELTESGNCVGLNCEGAGCGATADAYEGDPGSGAPIVALAKAAAFGATATWLQQVTGIADWPALRAYYAVEAAISDVDGLPAAGQNFVIYQDEASGLLEFIPTGQDLSWGNFGGWYPLHTPWGPPTAWCPNRVDEFYQRLVKTPAALAQLRQVWQALACGGPMTAGGLKAVIDGYRKLLKADLEDDPKGSATPAQIANDFSELKAWAGARASLLVGEVGGCP